MSQLPPPNTPQPPAAQPPYPWPAPQPIQLAKIRFTGDFWPWFGMNLLWALLTIITVGLFGFYMAYWNGKYFVDHLQLELPVGVR